MPSYNDQVQAAQNAHTAVNSTDATSRQQVANTIAQYQQGQITADTAQTQLQQIVRNAYLVAGAIAVAYVISQVSLPDWTPKLSLPKAAILRNLLSDVKRNWTDFEKSDRGEVETRRMVLRGQMGASTGAQRGFTDASIGAYSQLADKGYLVHKVWVANYVDNTPCALCDALHGTEIGLDEVFESGTTSVYHTLDGPPRHPNCQCKLVTLITGLDNADDTLDLPDAKNPSPKVKATRTSLSTGHVKSMHKHVYDAALATLKKVRSAMKRKVR